MSGTKTSLWRPQNDRRHIVWGRVGHPDDRGMADPRLHLLYHRGVGVSDSWGNLLSHRHFARLVLVV